MEKTIVERVKECVRKNSEKLKNNEFFKAREKELCELLYPKKKEE